MSETIEVLGCVAKVRGYYGEPMHKVSTPLGTVLVYREERTGLSTRPWHVSWWPRRQRKVSVEIVTGAASPAAAAREATRRLRAIQRVCARAGAL